MKGLRLLAALALLLTCGGCAGGIGFVPDTLYISIETSTAAGSAPELGGHRRVSQRLIDKFRSLNPGVDVHVSNYPADGLVAATRYRNSRGLGPDLIVSRVITAQQLHQQGLSSAVTLKRDTLDRLHPRFLKSFREGSKEFAVPFLAQPQVACYDRRRLREPPRTIDELLALSAKGLRVGLPLTISELFWTTTAQGASDVVGQLLEGPANGQAATFSAADHQALDRWIRWLHDASLQQNVSFSDDPLDLIQQLQRGQRDWISCNSVWIDGLRQRMGPNLGVSVLPGGTDVPTTPISRLLVWSFGRHSSARQRLLAERFVAFTLNEVTQKQLMDSVPGNLPVNPNVLIPTRSSALMASLAFSLDHSRLLDFPDPEGAIARSRWLESVLEKVVLGELPPAPALAQLLARTP
ncbi:extracellular solute-binding protein [Synechococcus sp. RedBA-s]|nr:extracellular solute-binding protein [Synechococcus sp. RedBA-s]